jgi:8-oxo-dGTP pyrophosphatase MutT (NUDIX family)
LTESGRGQVRVPEHLAGAVRGVIEGRVQPVTPRDAATVMLLRPSAGGAAGLGRGFEVYMLRRKPTMAFAPGAYVFPGGSVDQRDADEEVAWAGPDVSVWAGLLGTSPSLARAVVCAAVRETFEESGVLLAGAAAEKIVADTTGDDWEADRQALLDRSVSLAELLARRGMILRSDLLRPWARWITPAAEPRRFDARFFAAALPAGQRTRDVGGEASAVQWISPAGAIDAGRAGEIELWLPTAMTLAELSDYSDIAGVLAAEREIAPRRPELFEADGETWLSVPGNKEYPL